MKALLESRKGIIPEDVRTEVFFVVSHLYPYLIYCKKGLKERRQFY